MDGFIATIRNGHTGGCAIYMGWGDRDCDCGYEVAIERVEKKLGVIPVLSAIYDHTRESLCKACSKGICSHHQPSEGVINNFMKEAY